MYVYAIVGLFLVMNHRCMVMNHLKCLLIYFVQFCHGMATLSVSIINHLVFVIETRRVRCEYGK